MVKAATGGMEQQYDEKMAQQYVDNEIAFEKAFVNAFNEYMRDQSTNDDNEEYSHRDDLRGAGFHAACLFE